MVCSFKKCCNPGQKSIEKLLHGTASHFVSYDQGKDILLDTTKYDDIKPFHVYLLATGYLSKK